MSTQLHGSSGSIPGLNTPNLREQLLSSARTLAPQIRSAPFEDFLPGDRFGRLFDVIQQKNPQKPLLQPHTPVAMAELEEFVSKLEALGSGPLMNEGDGANANSQSIPAGFTFLGQFIDHDITFDTTTSLSNHPSLVTDPAIPDPQRFRNFRTPNLDLDCIYGSGPDAMPFLYQQKNLQTEVGSGVLLLTNGDDLQRNTEGRALIGDPRNDENVIIAQLQLAFLHFHNQMVRALVAKGVRDNLFQVARRHVIAHYHFMILNDFLPRIIGTELTTHLHKAGNGYYNPTAAEGIYMPVEFSVAAYRYGHSQVRENYRLNAQTVSMLFTLGGFKPVTAAAKIDWRNFFAISTDPAPQMARKIDTHLPNILFDLRKPVPPIVSDAPISLAARNLLRGALFDLPSGQEIARQMVRDNLMSGREIVPAPPELELAESPLWYYILHEAQELHDGEHLGPVGGRIVGEVLMQLMKQNPISPMSEKSSYDLIVDLRQDGSFTMVDLLRFANVL